MYRCLKCGQPWDELPSAGQRTNLHPAPRTAAEPAEPLALTDLNGCDLSRLPYPVALTARRLGMSLEYSGDVLKTLFLLKDCVETTIKYLSAVLLADYRRSTARTAERTEILLKSMVKPSLGTWINDIARPVSLWLIAEQSGPGASSRRFTPPRRSNREATQRNPRSFSVVNSL